jgi:adenylate cyclase
MDRPERRLAAIVAADVVGYSRLMQEDDQAALRALNERRALFARAIAARRGRIVNAPGDSILAEFASAVDAVEAASEFQRACAQDANPMRLRIGINLGEVLVDAAGAIYGNGVNVAARLESLALAGGICVSRAVRDQVQGRVALAFEDLGERVVKNIDPVHAFAVAGLGAAAAAPVAPRNSIAVLAFDNLSGDPEQEHFCDGVCEDIITDLAKIDGIAVMGRQSAFAYKGKANDLRKVARELGVRYLLEGSVRAAGNRIRVNAQLIEAESGVHLWAQRYDRTLEDVFLVGDEIAEEIVTSLDVKLGYGEQARIWRKALRTAKARELFYRGMSLYYAGMPVEMRKARELFLQVIEAEPESPWGYSQAAVTHCMEAIHGWTPEPTASLAAARSLAERSLSLDDTIPSGHGSLGVVELFAGRHDEAVGRLQRAYELRPMCAAPRALLGYAQLYAGDWQSAVSNARSAVELNPLFPLWFYYVVGAAQYIGGQLEASSATLQKVRAANPRLLPARVALIAAQMALGDRESARAGAAAVIADRPDFSVGRFAGTQPFRDRARAERYFDSLREAGLPS